MWPETSATLLDSLNDAENRQAWEEFALSYRPAVYRFARRMGLQDADAEDATQRVLQSVARSIESKPPDLQQGRFRSWLSQITRNAVLNLVARQSKHVASGNSAVTKLLHDVAVSEPDVATAWQHEERLMIYRSAAAAVRANCTNAVWKSFHLTAVEGHSPEVVAKRLGISVGVVYAARSRVLKRIRRAIDKQSSKASADTEPFRERPIEGDAE